MIKNLLYASVGLILAYFILVKSPIDAHSFTPPPLDQAIVSYDISNERLAELRIMHNDCLGCEDIAIDDHWGVVAGDVHGNIIQFKDGNRRVITNTGGRPLGMDIGEDGILYVADAYKGLLAIMPDGQVNILATKYGGLDFKFTDDVEYYDSVVYFTDASYKYDLPKYKYDILDHGGYGRVFAYDLRTGLLEQLAEGLQFANGITVARDGNYLLFTETGNFSVKKIWLRGDKRGRIEMFIDNLPGFPDGISRGDGDVYFLTLAAPRDPMLEKLLPHPWLRKNIMKLPKPLVEPRPKIGAMVLGIDEAGNIIENLQSNAPNFKMITSVEPHHGYLYFGSLSEDGIARLAIK